MALATMRRFYSHAAAVAATKNHGHTTKALGITMDGAEGSLGPMHDHEITWAPAKYNGSQDIAMALSWHCHGGAMPAMKNLWQCHGDVKLNP